MPTYAKITLLGHVGNVKMRDTKAGKPICTFSVAVNRYVDKKQFTDWFNVTTSFQSVVNTLEKGDLVFVEGKPSFANVNDKYYLNVWADTVRILNKKEKAGNIIPKIPEDDTPPF